MSYSLIMRLSIMDRDVAEFEVLNAPTTEDFTGRTISIRHAISRMNRQHYAYRLYREVSNCFSFRPLHVAFIARFVED